MQKLALEIGWTTGDGESENQAHEDRGDGGVADEFVGSYSQLFRGPPYRSRIPLVMCFKMSTSLPPFNILFLTITSRRLNSASSSLVEFESSTTGDVIWVFFFSAG